MSQPFAAPRFVDQLTVPPKRRPYAGALSILILGVPLLAALAVPGVLVNRQLDARQAEAGVRQVLVDGYGTKDVSHVTCNDGQSLTVKKGDTFLCEANIDRVKWQFALTFTDNAGTYDVGYPR